MWVPPLGNIIAKDTIGVLVTKAALALAHCSDSAKLDSQILLAFVLNKTLSYLYTWPDKTIDTESIRHYQSLLSRRVNGEPIAYIVGSKEFWSLPFYCSPATLIPRPDTEILVEQVLSFATQQSFDQCRCLDLGTGTGAIALALAHERPQWVIEAIDFSDAAILLAKKNAQQLGLTHVNIYQSDWFEQVDKKKTFDAIISNPPYIDVNDIHLEQGDVRFEPKSALIAENEGLADILLIATKAKSYLSAQGALFIEHGFEQAAPVNQLLSALGYKNIQTIKDLAGNDRVTSASIC